ncbi:hypothetical protein AAFF_G00440830, partial [Aldrovandia affinis]
HYSDKSHSIWHNAHALLGLGPASTDDTRDESFYPSSSRIMRNVTKHSSSQAGSINMTMSSAYSNGLHSHQISVQ